MTTQQSPLIHSSSLLLPSRELSRSLVVTSDTELYVSPSSVPISLTLAASSLLATLAVRAQQQARSLARLFALKASFLFRYPLWGRGHE